MNVPLRIINDHISEPTEGLTLKLVIPKVTSDNISIKQGVNSIAEGVIINSGKVILLTAINHVKYYLNPTTSRLSLLLHKSERRSGGRVLITMITYECSGI